MRKFMSVKRVALLVAIMLVFVITASRVFGAERFMYLLIGSPNNDEAIVEETAERYALEQFRKAQPDSRVTAADFITMPADGPRFWEVRFGSDGNAAVDPKTGEVIRISNERRFNELLKAGNDSVATETISKSVASQKVEQLSASLDIPFANGFSKPELIINQHGAPGLNVWTEKQQRKFEGYEFHDDWVMLEIDAFEGQLLAYSKKYVSNNPTSIEVRVSPEDAQETAQIVAGKRAFKGHASDPRLMIVNPNDVWESEMPGRPGPDTRLAWIVTFDSDAEVWVDAADGQLLGGVEFLTMH